MVKKSVTVSQSIFTESFCFYVRVSNFITTSKLPFFLVHPFDLERSFQCFFLFNLGCLFSDDCLFTLCVWIVLVHRRLYPFSVCFHIRFSNVLLPDICYVVGLVQSFHFTNSLIKCRLSRQNFDEKPKNEITIVMLDLLEILINFQWTLMHNTISPVKLLATNKMPKATSSGSLLLETPLNSMFGVPTGMTLPHSYIPITSRSRNFMDS